MKEDSKTEFKREVSDKITKAAVAFSNTEGGTIYVGIDDNGEVIGVNDPDSDSIRCAQLLNDTVRPDIIQLSDINLDAIEGKSVIRIEISEGCNKPYYVREKGLRAESVYIRKGTMNIPVSEDVFRSMIGKLRSVGYEDFFAFRQDLTFDYTSSVFRKKKIQFDREKMKALHLIRSDRYTNLAYMLSDQFDCHAKAALFPDEYKSSFLDRDEFTGSVLEQFDGLTRFVNGHNTLKSDIVGLDRIDRIEYPREAVREILLNALIHRDYSMRGTVLVSMYPDNMTVTSPGGLDETYTIEDLGLGVSALRNPKLANVFYRLGYIEAYGTGIPRAIKSYGGRQGPEFKSTASVFYVKLPSMFGKQLGRATGYITRSDLENEGLSRNEAIMRLRSLISEGKIEKIGGGRSTRYVVLGDFDTRH